MISCSYAGIKKGARPPLENASIRVINDTLILHHTFKTILESVYTKNYFPILVAINLSVFFKCITRMYISVCMKYLRNGDLILRLTIVRYSAREFSWIPYKFVRGDCFFRLLFSEKKYQWGSFFGLVGCKCSLPIRPMFSKQT